jgi:glutathione S-transferase
MPEELGEPYDLHLLSLTKGEQLALDYLAINPMGKVPALKHGEPSSPRQPPSALSRLADEFPQAKLNIPIGDVRRGSYLKWLLLAPGRIEPALRDRAYPRPEQPRRGTLGYGDFYTVMEVMAKAVEPGPYLMGDQFTAPTSCSAPRCAGG